MQEVVLTSSATRITPIIKVVGERCNLKCAYCYYNHINQSPDSNKIMSEHTLEQFISQYLSLFDGPVVFLWHGGEPLLAGLDFYLRALSFEEKYKKKSHQITNAIQTNGTLIDLDWANFFKQNGFKVSISIDGVNHVHDKFRTTISGERTSFEIEHSISTLRQVGIEPNVLQTITRSSLSFLKESFDYFTKRLHIHNWGINIFKDIEKTNPIMAEESLTNDDYYHLITTLFDLWLEKNDPSLIIREIEDYALEACGKTPDTCSMSGNCSSFITVDWDGTVYPCCDNIISHKDVVPGCLSKNKLIDIINSDQRIHLAKSINSLPDKCKKCDMLYGCYNGCTYHRENGHNPYCKANRDILRYIKGKLLNV